MSDSTGAPKDDNSRRSAKLDSGTGEPHELKKDKSQALVKPPLDSTKNAPFIVERIPEFRSIAIQNFPEIPSPGFANLKIPSAIKGPSVEKMGLKREDFAVTPKRGVKNNVDDGLEDETKRLLSIGRVPFVGSDLKPEPDFNPVFIKNVWANPQLQTIPKHYPMEPSNVVVSDDEHTLQDITRNLSECFRVLSIQAKYIESPAGAALLTPDQVEMHVYLWKAEGDKQVCVELFCRRGDSVSFHRYARYILEAASGEFDPTEYKDYTDSRYLKLAATLLRTELTKGADKGQDAQKGLKLAADFKGADKGRDAQKGLNLAADLKGADKGQDAQKGLNLAADLTGADKGQDAHRGLDLAVDLIQKDNLDARILGMQSLCILTDPRKSYLNTCLLAARAILFGEGKPMYRHIHELVLNLVQKRCMGDDDALLKDMVVEYDSDDEEYFEDDEQIDESKPPEYRDSIKKLLNYALTILANSWDLLSTFESFETDPEKTHENRISLDVAVARFRQMAQDFTGFDIISSLLMELGRAEFHAHNACLAAKCLRILCQSSPKARERVKALSGKERAFRAEQVGKATNARLERESAALLSVF